MRVSHLEMTMETKTPPAAAVPVAIPAMAPSAPRDMHLEEGGKGDRTDFFSDLGDLPQVTAAPPRYPSQPPLCVLSPRSPSPLPPPLQ